MVSSLIKSLPLIVVIMTAGVDVQDWGVNYSPSYVCALKGSTVKISCTLTHPRGYEVRRAFWTKTREPHDFCSDPEMRGGIQCNSEYNKDTSSITLTAVTEADEHMYYCRFITDKLDGKWTGSPGVQLNVTDLQVETQQSVKRGDSVSLTCKSSCSLPQQTTFIWYRNTDIIAEPQRITRGIVKGNQLHLWSVSYKDEGNYRCAVRGHEHLISPDVYLHVDWVDGLQGWGVNYSPPYVCALKGSTVTISCTLTYTSYKLIKGFWTKPVGESPDLCSDPEKRRGIQCSSENINTYSITLTNVTEADELVYYCRFIDGQNRWTVIPGSWLDVTDLQVETQERVKDGDSVSLRCKSSCSLPQQTTFIWYRNTQILTDRTENLHLQSVNRSDAGNYKCEISGNNHHLISPAFYLNVEYPPQSVSVSISPSGVIVEGDSVTLKCISDSNPPALNFSWFKEGKLLQSGDTFSLINIKSEASGNYHCSARNIHGSLTSAVVTVNVMYAPRSVSVSISPSGVIVEGDSVTLNCSSDSNPPAEINWIKGGTIVGSGRIFSISNIRSDDSGEYKCRSRNTHGEKDSDAVMLNVMYAPRSVSVSISPSGVIVEGDSVTLKCISDSNPPAVNFSWFKEKETSAVGSGQSFSISSFNSSFSGRFYCEAQNKYGSGRSASVSLTVNGVQRDALLTVSGIVAGCGGLIFIIVIIIIVFIKRKKRREGGTEDENQKRANLLMTPTRLLILSPDLLNMRL
ncbi:hypothetical protein F2P79_007851 [Pimephales promelas]|nr:hypothetical protein F2P79_007851 [Pimephales promelas]